MLDAAELADWTGILSLVFGGCMATAAALEQCTVLLPRAGSLITLAAFLGVTICFGPSQLHVPAGGARWPRLRPPLVPLSHWAVLVAMFFTTNWLNNLAFAFQVPMPIHIIFRSGGLVINLVVGYTVAGKKYNFIQVVSVLLVSAGITLSTLAARHESHTGIAWPRETYTKYLAGIGLLFLSLVLSGFMGLWQERTFIKYGRGRWKESLFYTHFLALPLFVLLAPSLREEIHMARATPEFFLPLLVNASTQIVCIAGVNRLITRVSSVSVVMILAVRKAASLALSVAWAHVRGAPVPNPLRLWLGTAMVLGGTVAYAHASSTSHRTPSIRKPTSSSTQKEKLDMSPAPIPSSSMSTAVKASQQQSQLTQRN